VAKTFKRHIILVNQFVPEASTRRRSAGASFSGANLERVGDHNQRVTLQAVRARGPVTRVELAEATGLTPPAVANITKRLMDMGLVLEAGRLQGGRGQPAMTLIANPEGCFSIGIHIDRDHITATLVDFAGEVRARASQEIAFPLPQDVTAFWTGEPGRGLLASLPTPDRLLGIGVALPDDFGKVALPHRPASFDAWNSLDPASLFTDVGGPPVFVENDAAAAALAELQYGHGLSKPSFFYVLIAAGLGGGLIIEGEHFRGADGRSGELGFLPSRAALGGASDGVSVQSVVSLSALYAQIEMGGFSVADPGALLDLPPAGQALISDWIERAADALTDPMINISCLINPEAVYLGGRLPAAIVDQLATALNTRLASLTGLPAIARARRAATSADGPAIGAAILPLIDQLLPSRATLRKTA
jgi:predicted NBD/HSP70 family sugar kinase